MSRLADSAIGMATLDEWGVDVLSHYANALIPVHGAHGGRFPMYVVPIAQACRCRVVGGRWIYEPDACDWCKALGDEWNNANLPNGVQTT